MTRTRIAPALSWLAAKGSEALGYDYPPGCLTREDVDRALRRELRALLKVYRLARKASGEGFLWDSTRAAFCRENLAQAVEAARLRPARKERTR